MITKICPKGAFLENCTPDTILVSRFDMLFKYAHHSFSKEFYRWPLFKALVKESKLKNKSLETFRSKFGLLILYCLKLPEFGNKKEMKEYDKLFRRLIKKIDKLNINKDFIFRINLSSFLRMSSESRIPEFFQVLLSAEYKFEVYF
jgi:hypothetical protein